MPIVKKILPRLEKALLKARAGTRVKHYRGHGVHSPFVYSVVRSVLMKRNIGTLGDRTLFEDLISRGYSRKVAGRLSGLYGHCHCIGYMFAPGSSEKVGENRMLIVEKEGPENFMLRKVIDTGTYYGTVLVVLSSRHNRARLRICEELASRSDVTSIDNRDYFIYFYNKQLPKQHFKL